MYIYSHIYCQTCSLTLAYSHVVQIRIRRSCHEVHHMDVNFDYVIFTIEKKQKNVGFSSFGQLNSLLLLLVGCYCSERFSPSAEEFCRLEGRKWEKGRDTQTFSLRNKIRWIAIGISMKREIQVDQQTLLINLNTTAEYRGNTWGFFFGVLWWLQSGMSLVK